jgi:putative membrane protein
MANWVFRFIKGILIGSGFILPGVSGGALAAVFGVYERMIMFISAFKKRFPLDFPFFLPLLLGMAAGIIVFSFIVSFFFETYEIPILWFFIGCIFGILPVMWRDAGKKDRLRRHIFILVFSFVGGCALLLYSANYHGAAMPLNFISWFGAGGLIAFGALLPGFSPSNFLLYLNMYKPMLYAFKTLDFAVITPLFFGLAFCLFLFSKLAALLFRRCYSGMYHFILGIVMASAVAIIPLDYNYLSYKGIVCLASCLGGALFGHFMGKLENSA